MDKCNECRQNKLQPMWVTATKKYDQCVYGGFKIFYQCSLGHKWELIEFDKKDEETEPT